MAKVTVTKEQWEDTIRMLQELQGQLKVLQSDIDYLTYRRIPELERRLEDGKNNYHH